MDKYIFIYLIMAVIPGIVWLSFFLKKDVLPEPKKQVTKVFLCGFLACIPVIIFETCLRNELLSMNLPVKTYLLIKAIFVVGLVEETFKYMAARYSVMKSSHIDEPIDIPLYMIIAALGFATAENIIAFCNQGFVNISDPLILGFGRFISSTILHALASGTIGLFIALGIYNTKWRSVLISIGFVLGIMTHALFNFFLEPSIMKETAEGYSVLYSLFIVFILFIGLSVALNKIKKLKSVSKI